MYNMICFTYLLLAQRRTGLVALLAPLPPCASWGEREGEGEGEGVFLRQGESVVEVMRLGCVSKLSLFPVLGIDPVLRSEITI